MTGKEDSLLWNMRVTWNSNSSFTGMQPHSSVWIAEGGFQTTMAELKSCDTHHMTLKLRVDFFSKSLYVPSLKYVIWVGGRVKELGPLTNLSVFTTCFINLAQNSRPEGLFFLFIESSLI